MRHPWIRLGAGLLLLLLGLLCPEAPGWLAPAVFTAGYLAVGADVLWRACRNILHGQVFDENFLMCLATVGAFAVGAYPEGVAVMLLYQLGELFQARAVASSRKSIAGLMELRPEYANCRRDGVLLQVDPDEVEVGETIVVAAGERIPLDGQVLTGTAFLDTSALTGESVPRQVMPGDSVLSGSINRDGLLDIRVEKPLAASAVSRVLELVEDAGSKKTRSEQFITRFAAVYTPAVTAAAVLLAFLPPLLLHRPLGDWVYRALTFLMVSCPCALVISVPLTFFGGIGGASRAGVLVKGGTDLEALAKADIFVFDKTGTLTEGVFEVDRIRAVSLSEAALLELAAHAEGYSHHPIAGSLRRAYGQEPDLSRVTKVEERAGQGVWAVVDGREVLAGNAGLLAASGIPVPAETMTGTLVYLAVDGVYAGCIRIADRVKPDAAAALQALRKAGVRHTVMLTGDSEAAAREVADALGLDEVNAALLPEGKLDRLEALLSEKDKRSVLCYVGDGINDAPALSRADVGVAMGGLGTDAAIEAADVVIMTDEPSRLTTAIRIARRTHRIVRQNIVFALGVKLAVLLLSACGLTAMWMAVVADVGVSMLAVLNALRTLRLPKES